MKKLLAFISVVSAAAIMGTGCVFVGSQHPKNMSTDPRQPVIIHGDAPSTDEDIIEKMIPPMNQDEVTQNLDGIKNGVVQFNKKNDSQCTEWVKRKCDLCACLYVRDSIHFSWGFYRRYTGTAGKLFRDRRFGCPAERRTNTSDAELHKC